MEILKQKIEYAPVNIDPLELTLLSVEEYKQYEPYIPPMDDYWWLCSPNHDQDGAACVRPDGSIFYFDVDYSIEAVRPVLKFNNGNLRIADKFVLDECSWTVIADGIALCDTVYCFMPFRKDWGSLDANDYLRSDVKAYLDKAFERINLASQYTN